MKKLICTSLLALAISTSNAADHKKGFYARLEAGLGIFSSKIARDTIGTAVPFGGAAIGYKFYDLPGKNEFGTELNFRYKQRSKDQNKLKQYILFLNGFYDFHTRTIFTPHLTAGIGFARPELNRKVISNSFAWNAGFGSRAQITKAFDADLTYRFIGITTKKGALLTTCGHEISLGLVYNF